jgi:hypothetical protein
MTAPEAFADDVARRASSALAATGTRSEIFSIGDIAFKLISTAIGPDRWLGRAFLKGSGDCGDKAGSSHRLIAWDGVNARSVPPERPWGPSAHEPLGVVASFSNDNVRCGFDIHTSSLIVYNFRRNSSYAWFPSIAELPAWAMASPFRIPLSWLCNLHGVQIVHGAAVAIGGRAVLLAGSGGSGKSTTALACALSGMGYIGDDYCAVEPTAGKVHMVYRTAKVLDATLAMLPSLTPWIVNRDLLGQEKGVMFLDPNAVKLVRSAELSAILLPRVGDTGATSLVPATRAEAIKAILPSTVGGLMGGTSATPRAIMELARSVPAFHLQLGNDLDSVVEAVASQLAAA